MAAIDQDVLVTGASGFIASYLVKALLERGYRVRGTVRDLQNEAKTAHLRALPGAAERLTLFQADLLTPDSFDEAAAGVACVFHTASPFFFEGGTEENLVVPAVQGTHNVLASVAKSPSVQTVVLTSSTAAIYVDYGTRPADHVYSEADWSPEDVLRENNNFYSLSKTLAEKAAWAWAEEEGQTRPRLVTVNPTLVLGPMLQPSMNTSSAAVLGLVDGSTAQIQQVGKCLVDVRDVAELHIKAYEDASASGRYMAIGACALWSDCCERLRGMLPDAPIPTELDANIPPPVMGPQPPALTPFDCSRAEALLGRPLMGLEPMLEGTVEGLKTHGYIPSSSSE